MLATLYKDDRIKDHAELRGTASMLEKMYLGRVCRTDAVEAFREQLKPHQNVP
jgi:hypothetical protein